MPESEETNSNFPVKKYYCYSLKIAFAKACKCNVFIFCVYFPKCHVTVTIMPVVARSAIKRPLDWLASASIKVSGRAEGK